jgi:hypothetical protein
MPTTNIALAKHFDGKPVKSEEISIGLRVHYPSGLGGVFVCRCVSKDDEKAIFKSQHKDWPFQFEMKFGQPDFTARETLLFSEAINAYSSSRTTPNDEQRKIVYRAQELGYAVIQSYTQAHLTDSGYEKIRELCS